MLFLPSIRGTLFQVPYPVSSVFAAITKSAGVCTNNSHSGTSSPSLLRTCRGATQASRIIAEQHWEDRKTRKGFCVLRSSQCCSAIMRLAWVAPRQVRSRDGELVPEWELLVHTPAVFVRAANTGLTGYGTWKRVRRMGGRRSRGLFGIAWCHG